MGAEFGSVGGHGSVGEFSQHSHTQSQSHLSTASSPERPNPLLQLDEPEVDDYDQQPELCSASTQSQSTASKSVVTDNGQATSRLSCPLADVVPTHATTAQNGGTEQETEVYHLTFYSRKIGIQFQKAPPAPTKPKGLLTDALTADLKGESDGSDKTAAELRNIAAFSSLAAGRDGKNKEVCPLAMPQDIVLVCGFDGFDESGNNQRPKLGARLVAFDGVSVEVGHWTFDSIRKAIKARGRPLTMSFRNDFLTTEQRAVLTKAVMEVDVKSRSGSSRSLQHGRPPVTATPSYDRYESFSKTPEVDLSAMAQEKNDCCSEKLAAASQSVSTHYGRLRRMSSGSHSTTQTKKGYSSNPRSFSDVGSTTSSMASNFAPLVATLVQGVSDRKRAEPRAPAAKPSFTPQYLRRTEDSLEDTPQHQDFQSNLL